MSDQKTQKTLCGFRRKRVACCGLTSTVIIAAVVIVVVVLTGGPDDIETQEKTETISSTTADDLTVVRTAALSGTAGAAEGTLSLLRVTEDDSAFLALSDFEIVDSGCAELEVRLQAAGGGGTPAVVPLTAAAGTTDFTEPLDSGFDEEIYDEAALWCADVGAESQLGEPVDLVATTLLEGSGSTVIREAVFAGSGGYTVEGLAQIIGSSSIVDDALVTNYTLRFEDVDVSSGPDVFLYLTTDPDDPEDVFAEGSIRVELDESERGTFSFTGTFTQETVPGFVAPEDYVAAVVWCDAFSVFFGSGNFEDV